MFQVTDVQIPGSDGRAAHRRASEGRVPMRMFGRLLAAPLLAWLAGCNDSAPTLPISPSLPQPVTYMVSGIVSETVDGVSRPLAGRRVNLWISQPGHGWAQSSTTDHNGRYTAEVPKSRVFVTSGGQQPCLASVSVDNDRTIDVQLVPAGSSTKPPSAASPMITGFVYETTPQGRNPLQGVYVSVDAVPYLEVYVASTQTDDGGRFFVCRVDTPVGLVVSGIGYQDWSQLIPGTSDMVLEIELKRRD